MLRAFMRSKIHRATVTDSNLNYIGSITLSPELLEASDIGVHEVVQVLDIDNGNRFETYTILGNPGTNECVINGAAARLVEPGDKVIILTYSYLADHEVRNHEATVVHVDENNNILEGVFASL